MALSLDAFTEASQPCRPECPVVRITKSLGPKDRDVLTAAVDSDGITHAAIAKVLTDNGHKISQDAVGRHRRGDCACGHR